MSDTSKRIFFIGFNKTATTALHQFFESNGYTSYHHSTKSKKILAKTIHENIKAGRRVLSGIDGAIVYSDIIYSTHTEYIEAALYFKEIFKEYPESYFILQTRDMKDWLKSRSNHNSDHPFVEKAASALTLTKDEVVDFWKTLRVEHHKNVVNFFRRSSNFLIFTVDTDSVEVLIKFLENDFTLAQRHWRSHNLTKIKK
jgi:hypothetical protein